jgi:hypothetical protein
VASCVPPKKFVEKPAHPRTPFLCDLERGVKTGHPVQAGPERAFEGSPTRQGHAIKSQVTIRLRISILLTVLARIERYGVRLTVVADKLGWAIGPVLTSGAMSGFCA